MAIATTIDVTDQFNADNAFVQDMSGWDYMVMQFVNPSGTISIEATNNGGADADSQGSASLAEDFQTVQATLLADGTAKTAVAAAGMYRVGVVGRFVKFGGASAAADHVIMYLFKIG